MLDAQLPIKALLHITGDGLLNLRRIQASIGFVIEQLPEPQPIFHLIQARGRVSEAGCTRSSTWEWVCIVTAPVAAAQVHPSPTSLASAYDLGHATTDPDRRIWVRPKKLVSAGHALVLAES